MRIRPKKVQEIIKFQHKKMIRKMEPAARPDYPLPTSYLYGKIASALCRQHQGGWCKPPWNLCTKG
jgi:hypothetical protein